MTPEQVSVAFSHSLTGLLGPHPPSDIALAVSGGGDSMAMLSLAHDWARDRDVRLWVATVDHGLRHESADEAAMVAETCARLGHPHATLTWHWDGQGNVQAQARAARLALIDQWRGSVGHVLMGHTSDDVAETFLMRLGRGAGVRGLAAMQAARAVLPPPPVPGKIGGAAPPGARQPGYRILRPCLGMRRADLRHYLSSQGIAWIDDPSNDDDRFERVRLRKHLAQGQGAGLDVATLVATAERLAAARAALDRRACEVWERFGHFDEMTGDVQLNAGLKEVERETQLRLFSAALRFVASREYAPRREPLETLWDGVLRGTGGTLHGCEVRSTRDGIHIFREFRALADLASPAEPGALWDNRWRVQDDVPPGLALRALCEGGWHQIAERQEGAPAFRSARSLPSLWRGNRLHACPAMGVGPPGYLSLTPMRMPGLSMPEFLLSH